MDPQVVNFAVVACVIVGLVGCLAVISMLTFRSFVKLQHPQSLPQANYDALFAQLQQSVDSIAVEVERVAEAQRFSAKLLAEGAGARSTALTEDR